MKMQKEKKGFVVLFENSNFLLQYFGGSETMP